ncbi:MAG TPA: vWA domain-containing protein [Rhodothermales bacterium]
MRRNHSHISFILDRSGSMESLRREAIGGFNAFVDSQRLEPGTADLSLILFDHEYLPTLENVDMKRVPHLTDETYVPRGTTALHDAIGRTIDDLGVQLAGLPESKRPEKVIVAILTDGLENASSRYTPRKVAQMIAHQREKYSWEFVFLGANQDAILTAQQLSIDPAAAYSFAPTAQGVAEAYGSLNREISMRRRMPRN